MICEKKLESNNRNPDPHFPSFLIFSPSIHFSQSLVYKEMIYDRPIRFYSSSDPGRERVDGVNSNNITCDQTISSQPKSSYLFLICFSSPPPTTINNNQPSKTMIIRKGKERTHMLSLMKDIQKIYCY